jgi:hypothetical protein
MYLNSRHFDSASGTLEHTAGGRSPPHESEAATETASKEGICHTTASNKQMPRKYLAWYIDTVWQRARAQWIRTYTWHDIQPDRLRGLAGSRVGPYQLLLQRQWYCTKGRWIQGMSFWRLQRDPELPSRGMLLSFAVMRRPTNQLPGRRSRLPRRIHPRRR